MNMKIIARLLWSAFALAATAVACAQTDECPMPQGAPGERTLVVISDVHLGLGRSADGAWDPKEDFRWSSALQGFLAHVSRCTRDETDLVIAGDLLELWQPPTLVICSGPQDDLGCTPEELAETTRAIIRAHSTDFRALGRFADRGLNRLVLLPGNHDAGLMLPGLWQLVKEAVGARAERITRADSGQYLWASGRVLVEHGHQIGSDVNRYATWPLITREHAGRTYVVRPWGERFVQKLFNEQESSYQVIDNLSPETAGARYRMADRGLWSSAADVARFLAFNLFETSLAQKAQFLGGEKDPNKPPPPWDLTIGRTLGHKLFADALSTDDPFRGALLESSAEGAALRAELDALTRDPARLPDAELNALCDRAAATSKSGARCEKPEQLGAIVEKLLHPRGAVIAEHLRMRLAQPELGAMRVFIYGHTHELEVAWPLQVSAMRSVTILNTGAFQRVVDEAGFLQRAKAKGWSPAQALRQMSVEDLPPCYTAVFAVAAGGVPNAVTIRWHQTEDGPGSFVGVGDPACH
jgi:UDP-2,3-diacylglucosamine pyrophosphatase LpxH